MAGTWDLVTKVRKQFIEEFMDYFASPDNVGQSNVCRIRRWTCGLLQFVKCKIQNIQVDANDT